MNRIAAALFVCAGILPLGVCAGTGRSGPGRAVEPAPAPVADRAQSPSTGIEAWKEELEAITGGVWIASNAAYAEADGVDEYGMEFTLEPGGLSATGCLWGDREGELVAVFWRMFQAWDPTRNAGLFYQSHAAGIVGMGYLEDRGPDEPHLVQDFRDPDGTMRRVGHFERWEGPDRRISRSVDWSGSEWTPRREYTWVRVPNRTSRC